MSKPIQFNNGAASASLLAEVDGPLVGEDFELLYQSSRTPRIGRMQTARPHGEWERGYAREMQAQAASQRWHGDGSPRCGTISRVAVKRGLETAARDAAERN
jgi:hypothetical protein